jgi:hypothetical protein
VTQELLCSSNERKIVCRFSDFHCPVGETTYGRGNVPVP